MRIRVLLLAAVAGLLLFLAPVKDGRPLLSVAELKARAAGLREAATGRAGEEGARESEAVRTIYKWRDDRGTWHYSNVRPVDRPEAQEVKVPVSYVEGDGGTAPAPAGEEPGAPRSAAELLEQSRQLEKQGARRESELQRALREATHP